MISLRLEAKLLQIDIEGIRSAMIDTIIGAYFAAANELLEIAIACVPEYTGMSRGAFIPLAEYLGKEIPISPHPNAAAFEKRFEKYRKGERAYVRDIAAGRASVKVGEEGGAPIVSVEGDKVFWHYEINFLHWLNDFWPNPLPEVHTQAAYNVMTRGRQVMARTIKSRVAAAKLSLLPYILASTISSDTEIQGSLVPLKPEKGGTPEAQRLRVRSKKTR